MNTFVQTKLRPLLKQIKNSAESHIVLDCTTAKVYQVLKQAQQIGMMTDYHSYLITSLVSKKLMKFMLLFFARGEAAGGYFRQFIDHDRMINQLFGDK